MTARRPLVALGCIATAALALAGCSGANTESGGNGSDDTLTLSYAYFAPAVSFPSVQMQEWADQLSSRTDGRVEVELYFGGSLLGAGDIYDGVSQGVVDVGLDSPAYDTNRFPFSSVINVPMGLEDPVASSQTFLDLLLEFEPEEYADYQIITAFTTEASYFQTVDPVTSRASLRGTTLRGSAATIPVLEQLGTSPVGLPMNEVGEQLGTGVIDGYATSREVLAGFGLAESVNFVTDFPLGIANSFVAVMDQAKFDALPADVQNTILELREEMSQFAGTTHVTEIEEALVLADEQAIETVAVEPGELDAWNQILASQADAWVAAHAGAGFDAQAVLDRARALAGENSAENS